jgi:hypothetical protein
VVMFLFNLVIFLWSSLCLLYKELLAFYWLRFGNNASDYIKIKTNISFTPFSFSATPPFCFPSFQPKWSPVSTKIRGYSQLQPRLYIITFMLSFSSRLLAM